MVIESSAQEGCGEWPRFRARRHRLCGGQAVSGGLDNGIHGSWRVIAIGENGLRVVVDEGLSDEEALRVAAAMLNKGHPVTIESDAPQRRVTASICKN